MDFVPVAAYNNYIDANIILGRLQEEGVDCWLKDENTSTIMPVWNQATGGIRLMAAEADIEKAVQLLKQFENEKKQNQICPFCKSSNIELISTPRKPINWLSAITTFFLGDYAMTIEKVYHCFDCKKEFKQPLEKETAADQ
jgi:Putative prokaryotic signal transducing protein